MYKKKDILRRPVRDIRIKKGMSVRGLIKEMENMGGFSGQHMVNGIHITERMLNDRESFNFLSFPGDIVSTGLRGVLAGSVKHFDAIITTCGTLDHDLARASGGRYNVGSFESDDTALHKIGVYRLGNVFIEKNEYGLEVENAFRTIIKDILKANPGKTEYSASEIIREFGKRINDDGSIMRQAYLHNVPIYCPGILDGAFGTQLTIFSQDHDLKLNLIKDELELSNISFDNKKTGAFMIGGGISKHHVIWWNQFKGGLDYAVYVTTASQYDGSLSGARLTEAVSWGKVKENAEYVTIDGDATIILPVMFSCIDLF
jgi:deoxyhypusine synthase